MRAATLEDLFERFRTRGDLGAMAEVFDRTAPRLLAFAAHLARDPVEAEDLVQATFLAALERKGDFERGRRLEAWLAGILVRKAKRLRRERARRPDPGRVRVAEPDDPATVAEDSELTAELRRALAELEPEDRALLERHLAGERSVDVARATGRAPGTVRMHVLRALERLRRVLPAGLHGLAPVGVVAPRGLDALRHTILGRAESAVAAGPAAASAATVSGAAGVLGGLVMSLKTTAAAAVAAAVLLGSWFVLREGPRPAGVVASPRGAALVAPPVPEAGSTQAFESPRRERESRAGARPPAPEAAPQSQPPPGLWLVGDLLGLEGVPAEEIALTAADLTHWSTAGHGGEDGTYALRMDLPAADESRSRTVLVSASHSSGLRANAQVLVTSEMRARSRCERVEVRLDLDLRPRTVIEGLVVLETGEPARADLLLWAGEESHPVDVEETSTVDGRFRFALSPGAGGDYHVVAHALGLLPSETAVSVADGTSADAGTLVLRSGGAAIEGLVSTPVIDPGGLVVRARRTGPGWEETIGWSGLRVGLGAPRVVEQEARVMPDGSFVIAGLEPGEHELILDRSTAEELVVPRPLAIVSAPASGVLLGEHLGRVTVSASARSSDVEIEVGVTLDRGTLSRTISTSGMTLVTDGRILGRTRKPATLAVVADRRVDLELEFRADGFVTVPRVLEAGFGLYERVDVVLEPDRSAARLVLEWAADEVGAPDGVRLFLPVDGGARYHAVAEGGTCTFEDLPVGDFVARLEAGGAATWELPGFHVADDLALELLPGRTTRVRVNWRLGGGARFLPTAGSRPPDVLDVEASLHDAVGRVRDVRFVTRDFDSGRLSYGARTGSIPVLEPSTLEPRVTPGTYELVLVEHDQVVLRVPFTVVAGEVVDVPFVLP